MNTTIVAVGAVVVCAAIVGGALKGWNIEFPLVTGKWERIGLAAFGLFLVLLGSIPAIINEARGNKSAAAGPTADAPTMAAQPSTPGPAAPAAQPSVSDDIDSSSSPSGVAWLADMTPVASEDRYSFGDDWISEPMQVKGTTYDRPLSVQEFWCDWTEVDYAVGGRYGRFTAKVGIADNSPETDSLNFYVLAEERQIKQIQGVDVGEVRSVDLSIEGVSRLSIGIDADTDDVTDCTKTVGVWIDPRVSP
jgi:NPCBM/NEW2 domain